MAEHEYAVELERHFAAPAPIVWALVADTNRWDRAAGLTPGRYAFEPVELDGRSSRERVCRAREMGVDLTWVEPPYQWVEGRLVRGERRFLSGPATRGGFAVDLRPTPDGGTDVTARAFVAARGVLGAALGPVMRVRFRRALGRYLEALAHVLAGTTARGLLAPSGTGAAEPPAALAARALLATPPDPVASGHAGPVNEADLSHRVRRFDATPVPEDLRARIVALVRERPDEELTQIRPFELARAWQQDRRAVLRAFLFAARSGLLDLRWQLNCPTCRVAAASAATLADVGANAHCDACEIAFDLDFAAHVEAVFRPNPAVRKVDSPLYCASSPWFLPHVLAQATVGPRARRELAAPLPTGPLLARVRRSPHRARVELDAPPPATLTARLTDAALELVAEGRAAPGADTTLVLENATDAPATVLLERAGWNADAVLGSVIATQPEFLDLFAAEAPAAGVELEVGTLTMLFSDLTGSTALYERVGDARAFAMVQAHFRAMTAAVARHGGAIVKTMGDAVMASFQSPAHALASAFEMVRDADAAHAAEGLSVKLGVHEGPCLAVRANERLDFFGTTVNVAARLQAQARGGEVVVLAELLEHPEVAALVARLAPARRTLEATLKGIREAKQIVALDARSVAAEALAAAS